MPKTDIAILAKAPVPGFAKTRLIPTIGAHAAAVLQERLMQHAAAMATEAAVGPVTVWCAPDPRHAAFRDLVTRHGITLRRQPGGDLGARMLAATMDRPALVIGTDCPALTAAYLRAAADALMRTDVVLIPAADGGYVLIGTRSPQPALFDDVMWGTDTVLTETRGRIVAQALSCIELEPLWDVDTEDDLARMEREMPALAL